MSPSSMPLLKVSNFLLRRSMLSKWPQVKKKVVFYLRSLKLSRVSSFCMAFKYISKHKDDDLLIYFENWVVRLQKKYITDSCKTLSFYNILISMKDSDKCWKIRKLYDVPQATLSKIQKREWKRIKHCNQELLIIQCTKCKLVLHRSNLPSKGLRNEANTTSKQIFELDRINVKTTKEEIILFCAKCKSRVATVNQSHNVKMVLQAVIMQIPEGRLIRPFEDYRREPYDMLGAFSGLSYRKTMAEIYRLSFTKQARYQLLLKELTQKCRNEEKKFKGLYNLILLTENSKQKASKADIPKLQYDKMMRSTTIEHSSNYPHSKSQIPLRRKEFPFPQ